MEAFEYLAKSCSEALAGITSSDREKLVSQILSGKRIFIFGVGRSGLVGQTFAIRLVQLGLQVYFVGDMTTPIIGKDDVMILISNTGSTMSVVKTAEIAQRLGTYVIGITSDEKSNLANVRGPMLRCPRRPRSVPFSRMRHCCSSTPSYPNS